MTSRRTLILLFAAGEVSWTATMDSPDQGAKGIPCSSISLSGTALRIEVKAVGGFFEGTLDEGAGKLQGKWSQAGTSFPLVLQKGEAPVLRRPQVPKPPFPYAEQEVTIENTADGVRLGGTLTLPAGKGPFPAVQLVTGNGQQNRDEEIFGRRPFHVISDSLARRGIAVLRCDDRGVGASTGDPREATSADFARDARAELEWLRRAPSVDPSRVGVAGPSEGGLIAAMLAAEDPGIAFIVLLAGPGLPGDELLVLQNAALARAGLQGPPADAAVQQLLSPWFSFFLSTDPGAYRAKVRCPVLALNGEKDLQVTAKENLAAIRAALAKAGNARTTVRAMPGLNHLFQAAATGRIDEYGVIEETVAPAVLETVGGWILSTAGR